MERYHIGKSTLLAYPRHADLTACSPLLRMFYLEFHLRRFSESTLKLTQTCLEYATIYDEPRIIWPTTLLRYNFARHEEDAPYLAKAMKGLSEDVESGIPPDAEFVNIETRDPDHLPPRRVSGQNDCSTKLISIVVSSIGQFFGVLCLNLSGPLVCLCTQSRSLGRARCSASIFAEFSRLVLPE